MVSAVPARGPSTVTLFPRLSYARVVTRESDPSPELCVTDVNSRLLAAEAARLICKAGWLLPEGTWLLPEGTWPARVAAWLLIAEAVLALIRDAACLLPARAALLV